LTGRNIRTFSRILRISRSIRKNIRKLRTCIWQLWKSLWFSGSTIHPPSGRHLDTFNEGWGNYGSRFWHCPLARVSYGNDICSSTMLGLLTFLGNFTVLRRWWQLWLLAMGGSPNHWPISELHQLPPRHRHLQPATAPGRITCFPRSSRRQPLLPFCDLHLWMPREDERLVSSSFTSTTTIGVLHVVSAVLRRRLLALWPVLVQ
jgi:hypothetical protein